MGRDHGKGCYVDYEVDVEMRRSSPWPALLGVGLLLGCQPRLPDVDAYGQRVAVGSETDVELCAGTLDSYDEHVRFVEEELGIARPANDMIEVFVVEDTASWCRDVEACYIGGWVDATFVPADAASSVWHELVHHVVAGSDIGMTDRFLSEGLASAMGDDWCPPTPDATWPSTPLTELLGQEDVAFKDYPRGAVFIDFVRESYGTDALVELIRCVHRGDAMSRVEACFERTFGRGVAAVGREFELAAPPHHPNPALCRGPVERWSGDAWSTEVPLGCGDAAVVNTFSSATAREVVTLLEIPRPGWYELAADGDGAATVDLEPCFCSTTGARLYSEPASDLVWVGEAGTHRVVVSTADPSTTRARVSLTPSERELAPPV